MSVFFTCATLLVLLCFYGELKSVDSSRVLMFVPTPMHSHQIPFQAVTKELLRRGHEVVVVTTDPMYQGGVAATNLTEIDVHDVSYKIWADGYKKAKLKIGNPNDFINHVTTAYNVMYDMFPKLIQTNKVRDLLADKTQKFDLVIVEAWVYQALALAQIYNAPAILMSTLGIEDEMYEDAGAPVNPVIYPDVSYSRRYNLPTWDCIKLLYTRVKMHFRQNNLIESQDVRVKELFGADMPSVREMRRRAVAQFVSLHSVWEGHRPLPLNIVRIAGLHLTPPKSLPEDLGTLMNSSKHGVIYISFGSHFNPGLLPPERLAIFARVFSTLPYDVVWKWKGESPVLSSNVHTFSWLPQADLLRHEKLLLFITQGGLQSMEEALHAGVPVLGIPLMLDQWLNIENCERLGFGLGLDLHTFTENQLRKTIDVLINNKRYRENSVRVGRTVQDQPQTSLERAVWWAERAMRLRGRQIHTPPPSLTWDDILQALLFAFIVVPLTLIMATLFLYRQFKKLALKVRPVERKFVFKARGNPA